ncbi:MAG: ROK family protein [Ilumatobacteraceae bacterium]
MRRALAVDIGGTKIAAALVTVDGEMSERRESPTPADQGPGAVLDAVAELVADLVTSETGGIAGVGIGTAGAVDTRSGRIVSSTDTIGGWAGTDVRSGIGERLGGDLPAVVVHNDVDAHALGEAWLGAARTASSALMIAVGTGIGGAIIVGGRLWTGEHHAAGEIGHVPTPGAEGLRCPCSREGHLEALASGASMARRYRTLTGADTDARTVIERAEAGEPVARRIVRDAALGLGHAIAGLVTTIDPACVVVGGGVAESGAVWWEPMIDTCRADLIDALAAIPIVRAELGPAAALLGAARAVFDAVDETRPDEDRES